MKPFRTVGQTLKGVRQVQARERRTVDALRTRGRGRAPAQVAGPHAPADQSRDADEGDAIERAHPRG